MPGGWPCAMAPWPNLLFSPAWQKLWGTAVLPWPKCKDVRQGLAGSIRSSLFLLPPPLEGRVATSSWERGCRGVSPFPPILPGSGTACDVPFQGSHSWSPWFMDADTAGGCKKEGMETLVCVGRSLLPPEPPRRSLGGAPGPCRAWPCCRGRCQNSVSETLCKVVLNMQHLHKYIYISTVQRVGFLRRVLEGARGWGGSCWVPKRLWRGFASICHPDEDVNLSWAAGQAVLECGAGLDWLAWAMCGSQPRWGVF